jgi:hypothetical protein
MAISNLGIFTRSAGTNVKEFRVVKAGAGNVADLCGASDKPIGVVCGQADYVGMVPVRSLYVGINKVAVSLSAAVEDGDPLALAANGCVEKDDGGEDTVAVAVSSGESTATDNAIIEVVFY